MANTQICGRRAFSWDDWDTLGASVQRDAKATLEAHTEMQSKHMQLRIRLHDEAEAKQVERDRMVMINARKFHPRHRTINNANLATEIFGIDGWHSACALCKKMGFDPKSIRCEVINSDK